MKIVLKFDFWKSLCLVLGLALILLLFANFTGRFYELQVFQIDKDEIARKTLDYINKNLVQPGTSASFVSVEEESGVYKIVTKYLGNEIPVYVTKDGKFLFLQGIDMTKKVEERTPQQFDAPDSEKPTVELYVMSFCPYGNQAEDAMLPVIELLKEKADFRLRYIVNVYENEVPRSLPILADGKTYYIDSLHGPSEAWENLVELCVQKYYPTLTFWKFVVSVNQNCSSIYRDINQLNECWQSIAKNFEIDVNKIIVCANSTDGLQLILEDTKLTQKLGVTGSPTLFINGERYYGARTPNAFKEAVCSGFIQRPAECEETLSSEEGSVHGSC
jgi:protein-disulfide isomerase